MLCAGLHIESAQAGVPFKRAKFHLAVFFDLKFAPLRFQFFFRQHFTTEVLFIHAAVPDELPGLIGASSSAAGRMMMSAN
jgi:hypothetical protein